MLKYFSRILIFTLMLTAPLSFTGDTCPDFKPACELKESQHYVTAAVLEQECSIALVHHSDRSAAITTIALFLRSSSLIPINQLSHLPLHERAPPSNTLS